MKQAATWILAFLIAASAAVYQRMTGPTYPVRGTLNIAGDAFKYKLLRSWSGDTDQPVTVPVPEGATGKLFWKLYPGNHPWHTTIMDFSQGKLTATLPHQPPAGKIEYYVIIEHGGKTFRIPEDEKNAVTRFKGSIPAAILIPHIIFMFAAMLTSNKLGLSVLFRMKYSQNTIWVTLGLFILGGLVLGCIIQYYAFGQPWTGFPVGHDLTDNKVAIAILSWIPAAMSAFKRKENNKLVLLGALMTFIIFLIPHSMLGSELKR